MPDVAKKIIDKKDPSKSQNLHLSDDVCTVCGGNLPKDEDVHILQKDHGSCITKVLRMVLAGRPPQ